MQNLQEEIWKDIPGFNNIYQVSNIGNVKNINTHKILYKNSNITNEYLFVNLGRGNKRYIHRFVYASFKGFSNGKNIINHIDSDKTNNNINNLEECTYSYNLKYASQNGERKLKPISQYSLSGELIVEYRTGKEASDLTGVSRSSICNCAKGKRESANGYKWSYTDKPNPL